MRGSFHRLNLKRKSQTSCTLTKQPLTQRRLKRKSATTYRASLEPWAIIRWLSPVQRIVVGRFRNRSDADGHLIALRRLMPASRFEVIFDVCHE